MSLHGEQVLLRIYLQSADRAPHTPTYERIVKAARARGLAGATVLRGILGLGAHSVVHKSALLEMSTDLPIVIEIVDTEDKIKLLLPRLELMVAEGMITMEYVVILLYRHDDGKKD